jgi:hypothetical protein
VSGVVLLLTREEARAAFSELSQRRKWNAADDKLVEQVLEKIRKAVRPPQKRRGL